MINGKRTAALTPPMGWNSWDCYGASVTEKELLENAEYMSHNLKKYGWEYVVCDIQWYEPDTDGSEYRDFVPLCMDEFSRLIPAENKFPSAAGGVGFRNIADKIHGMGLKFGIHIMRGIPRQAVHQNTAIKGSFATARQIAQRFSVCSWNTDMYGVNPNARGAQDYYDSVMELYASWGVDFIKVDDICNTYFRPDDLYSAKEEIEMIRRAIDKTGREIVLSLSPGPADIACAEHLKENANMWRITGDYWDRWEDLLDMFKRCEQWASHAQPGGWPDCDMLPLSHLAIRSHECGLGERHTRFTKEEQKTMMTLWCICRSPLMFGGLLTDLDDWTFELITNEKVLRLLGHSYGAHQVSRTGYFDGNILWKSYDEDGSVYFALFNTYQKDFHVEYSLGQLGLEDGVYEGEELWTGEKLDRIDKSLDAVVPVHGVKLYRIKMQPCSS
ncbi:glycoside hydrolase family 27 protein [Blautia schinkii]|nr:glycoside hydrolase family 27 protein [Blautia schinkii]